MTRNPSKRQEQGELPCPMDTGGHHGIERNLNRELSDKRTTAQRRLEIAALGENFAARVARNRHTSPEVLLKLSMHASYEVRCGVAQNPSAPPLVLEELLKGADSWLAGLAAVNLNLTDTQMDRLSRSSSIWAKQAIASRPDVPVPILVRLGHVRRGRVIADDVHKAVARNPRTPESTLRQLAPHLFFEVARNPGLSPGLIRELVSSKDEERRRYLVWRLDLPEDVIELLRNDPSDAVREAFRISTMGQKTLSIEERLDHLKKNPSVALWFFRDWDLTGVDIERLFEDGFSDNLAWHAFQHPKVPISLLRRFIDDRPMAYGRYILLLRIVALNPALSPDLLNELCAHANPDVLSR